jgi:hypothetical protein
LCDVFENFGVFIGGLSEQMKLQTRMWIRLQGVAFSEFHYSSRYGSQGVWKESETNRLRKANLRRSSFLTKIDKHSLFFSALSQGCVQLISAIAFARTEDISGHAL